MAFSRVTYDYAGQTTFAIDFTLGYLKESHVTARVNDEVDGSNNPVYRTITFITPGTVSISGTWEAGDSVVFERNTPKDELVHDYEDGALIIESNLDESNLQNIMIAHEALDGRLSTFEQDLDMGSHKIINLEAGVADTDAANMSQINAVIGDAQAFASAAEVNKDGAVNALAAAETARDAALAVFDEFDDVYLGVKPSDPTLDNDGDALQTGSLYYNTTVSEMRVYDGSVWAAAYVPGTYVLARANNLSDLSDVAIARTNLGLGALATLDTLADWTNNPSGTENEVFGSGAGGALSSGSNNSLFGEKAGEVLSSASQNTLIGSEAGADITNGYGNTAVGSQALWDANANFCTAVGSRALYDSNSANSSTAIGYQAIETKSGSNGDVGVGYQALDSGGSSSYNVAVGYQAGKGLQSSSYNVAIGYQVCDSATTGDERNILVGYQLDLPSSGTDDHLNIGNLLVGSIHNAGTKYLDVQGELRVNSEYTFPTVDGTANQVLVTDGSGDVSWGSAGSQIKVGTTTHNLATASGTIVITGVGFTPKAVDVFMNLDASDNFSMGFADASLGRCVTRHGGSFFAGASLGALYTAGSGNRVEFALTAFSADGFTITYTKFGSPNGLVGISYKAMG